MPAHVLADSHSLIASSAISLPIGLDNPLVQLVASGSQISSPVDLCHDIKSQKVGKIGAI